MANFDSGVKGYVLARCTVEVGFPIDFKGNAEIACKHCKFYRQNYRICGLNGEIVAFGEKFVGDSCPLEPVEEE